MNIKGDKSNLRSKEYEKRERNYRNRKNKTGLKNNYGYVNNRDGEIKKEDRGLVEREIRGFGERGGTDRR